jgi:hypothetical protein
VLKGVDRLFVVAHSHGGTVLSYALKSTFVSARIAGCVYLGTPFLRVAPRDFRVLVEILARAAKVLLILLAIAFFVGETYVTVAVFVLGGALIFLYIGAYVVAFLCEAIKPIGRAFAILGPPLGRAAGKLADKTLSTFVKAVEATGREQESLVQILRSDAPDCRNVIVVSTPKDEAGLLLRTWMNLSELPYKVFTPESAIGIAAIAAIALEMHAVSTHAFETAIKEALKMGGVKLEGVQPPMARFFVAHPEFGVPIAVLGTFVGQLVPVPLIVVVAGVVIQAAAAFWAALVLRTPIALGRLRRWNPFEALLVAADVLLAPSTKHEFVDVPAASLPITRGALFHKALVRDEQIGRRVGSWISKCAAEAIEEPALTSRKAQKQA